MTSADDIPVAEPAGTRVVKTLEKGLQVLSLFDADHPQWSLRDVREATGESKTTVLRLIKTLERLGYVARDARTGKYRLSTAITRLVYVTLSHGELARIAELFMRRLSERTSETVDLSVEVEPGLPMVLSIVTGRYLSPPHRMGQLRRGGQVMAAGKLFTAFRPEETWDEIIAEAMRVGATADPGGFREELVRARAEGVAFEVGVWNGEIGAVAAPVFASDGGVTACLSVLVPSERFGPGERTGFAIAVRQSAADLSQELGAPRALVDFLRSPETGKTALVRLESLGLH